MKFAIRLGLLLPLLSVAVFLSRDETGAVLIVMLAAVAWPCIAAFLGIKKKLISFVAPIALGLAVAAVLHVMMSQMLGGFVRADQLLWSAWFYTGCFAFLEILDSLLNHILQRFRHNTLRSVVRLIVILLIVPPAAVAVLQTVRVKVGYDKSFRSPHEVFQTTTTDHIHIHGYYFDRNSDTTIIFAHGLGAHSQNFLPYLTTTLKHHKVNGLIFDMRGHGYSAGHVASFGYHERKDMRAIVRWLEQNHPTGSKRLIFYGFSMGSAAAISASVDTPQTIGMVIDSGFARLTDVAQALVKQLPYGAQNYVYYCGMAIASAVTEAPLWKICPEDDLKKLDVPVRIVHGSADRMIPANQGRRLLKHRTATGRIIGGGQHTNLPNVDPNYGSYIGRFIELLLNQNSGNNTTVAPGIGGTPSQNRKAE